MSYKLSAWRMSWRLNESTVKAGHAGCVSVPARSDPWGGHSFLRPSVEEAWGPGWVCGTGGFYLQESVEALHVGSPSHDCSATGALSDPAKPDCLGWLAQERPAIPRFAAPAGRPAGCAKVQPKDSEGYGWSVQSWDSWPQDTEPQPFYRLWYPCLCRAFWVLRIPPHLPCFSKPTAISTHWLEPKILENSSKLKVWRNKQGPRPSQNPEAPFSSGCSFSRVRRSYVAGPRGVQWKSHEKPCWQRCKPKTKISKIFFNTPYDLEKNMTLLRFEGHCLPLTSYQDIEGISVNLPGKYFHMNTGPFPSENSFSKNTAFFCSKFLICRTVLLTGRELVGFVSDRFELCSLRAYDKIILAASGALDGCHAWNDKNLKILITWKGRHKPVEQAFNKSRPRVYLSMLSSCAIQDNMGDCGMKISKTIVGKPDADSWQESISWINSFEDTHGYAVKGLKSELTRELCYFNWSPKMFLQSFSALKNQSFPVRQSQKKSSVSKFGLHVKKHIHTFPDVSSGPVSARGSGAICSWRKKAWKKATHDESPWKIENKNIKQDFLLTAAHRLYRRAFNPGGGGRSLGSVKMASGIWTSFLNFEGKKRTCQTFPTTLKVEDECHKLPKLKPINDAAKHLLQKKTHKTLHLGPYLCGHLKFPDAGPSAYCRLGRTCLDQTRNDQRSQKTMISILQRVCVLYDYLYYVCTLYNGKNKVFDSIFH